MTAYDLHTAEVNFQHVPVHHVLQELTRRFGSRILVDAIQRFEERDRYATNDSGHSFRPEPEHVLQ